MNDKPQNGDAGEQTAQAVFISLEADAALVEFLLTLEGFAKVQLQDDADRIARERYRLIGVLWNLAKFVNRAWLEPAGRVAVSKYLVTVIRSIEGLQHGVPHPLWSLDVVKRGAPSDRPDVWNARFHVALSLYCLERARPDKSQEQIADDIAERYAEQLKGLLRDRMRKEKRRTLRERFLSATLSWHRKFADGKVTVLGRSWAEATQKIEANCRADQTAYRMFGEFNLAQAVAEARALIPQGENDAAS